MERLEARLSDQSLWAKTTVELKDQATTPTLAQKLGHTAHVSGLANQIGSRGIIRRKKGS